MLVILSLNTNSTDRERVRYRIDFHFGPLGGQADLVSDLQKLVCRLYEYILVSSDSKCRVQDKLGNRASTVTGGQMRLEVRTFNFEKLSEADLYVDAWYEGGHRGNAGDDPLNALLSVSNQGGFRYRGNLDELQLVVLISTLNDPDWPDTMDQETGVFTCYGDNKHPGRGLHETPRHGNEILRQLFDLAHSGAPGRSKVPPILVFSKSGRGRDVVFIGLAVPGSVDLRPSEDLIAIWKSSRGRRFQNYRARLTILDVPTLDRQWINNILNCRADSVNAPKPWSVWRETGRYTPMLANRSVSHRNKTEQLPQDPVARRIIERIYTLFSRDPFQFERCAALLPG